MKPNHAPPRPPCAAPVVTPTPGGFAAGRGKLLVSSKELAREVGVSERLVQKWVSSKTIPSLLLSSRCRKFELDRVMAALRAHEVATLNRKK